MFEETLSTRSCHWLLKEAGIQGLELAHRARLAVRDMKHGNVISPRNRAAIELVFVDKGGDLLTQKLLLQKILSLGFPTCFAIRRQSEPGIVAAQGRRTLPLLGTQLFLLPVLILLGRLRLLQRCRLLLPSSLVWSTRMATFSRKQISSWKNPLPFRIGNPCSM